MFDIVKMTKILNSFDLRPKYRSLHADESRLYDKNCPVCGADSLIMKWSVAEIRYKEPRCSMINCDYGNDTVPL